MTLIVSHAPDSYLNPVRLNTHTCPISDAVSLRVYSSTEPHNSKIAYLQKGLILVIGGAEAVGEGTGFGLPVLVYTDETYFSGSSKIHVSHRADCCIIWKEFTMDRVARNSFRNVALENHAARGLITHLANLYQKHPGFRFLTLKELTRRMSINKVFPKTEPIGNVTVTYKIDKSCITVSADFKDLNRNGLQKIFMLNEQGSKLFRKYTDSKCTELMDKEIGAWDTVDGEWACLKTLNGKFGFRLWNVKSSVLRRGREFLDGSLDWVGLDYEISRRDDVFGYAIDVLGV